MASTFDPKELRDDPEMRSGFELRSEPDYRAAIGEMRDLIMADPETPDGRRFDELLRRIEEYESSRGLAAPQHAPTTASKKARSLRLV